jgi:light-regulated signal transduction histidine kinase (bacteriophytochrome)
LNRSNQELQDFAYVASHDLQEPLRKIQAFGNLLEEEYGDKLGDGKDYLRRMRSAAARMSALIEDILSFSRVTTKGRSFTPVDLNKVAVEVLEDLETRIEDTGATIHIEKLPTIDADAMQVRQLLQNLIANALKFHKPDVAPVVKISSLTEISQRDRRKLCTITIQDNGVGFDEKYLDRIFAVFQRLHSRDSYEGTGIGLAVCRKIVERHGGTISATSKPGHGAAFIVSLPVHHKKGETL